MQGIVLAQEAHIVNILPPVDITGGKTGVRFSMAKYGHATIIVQVGVSAAAWTKIILRECNAASAGTATDIAYDLYVEETDAGDTLSAKESVAATGRTPSANNNVMYIIELDGRHLSDGYKWVELALTNGSNSVIGSAIAILTGPRYSSDQGATTIA